MPPLIRDNNLSSLSRHPPIATSARTVSSDHDIEEQGPTNDDLFSHLPDGKRRKFILVDDAQRGCRVRVKVVLDKVNMDEIPDSYRESNAVYPRTYFPIQMRDENRVVPAKRFFRDDAEQGDDPEASTVGRTTVPAPSLDADADIEVPKLSRRKHRKDLLLNDLGYRMSWSQSRVFAGRMLFLQRSCKHFPFFFFNSCFYYYSLGRLVLHVISLEGGVVVYNVPLLPYPHPTCPTI
jgi:hypothetical protein